MLGTTLSYDATNLPERVTDPLGRNYDTAYNAAGNRSMLACPNTTSTTYGYDTRNRLLNMNC
jgi:YD repeat-containing protein